MSEGPIAIIGAGAMAIEYFTVLRKLGYDVVVLGRGAASAKKFQEATGHAAGVGDLRDQLAALEQQPTHAIIAVSVPQLAYVTRAVLEAGVGSVLLEKPGGVDLSEVKDLAAHPRADDVGIAYNRRFLPSTLTARDLVAADGGVTSFLFEFNENTPVIRDLTQHSDGVKRNWFFANSTHVVDMAFFIAGQGGDLEGFAAMPLVVGEDGTPPARSYVGAGQVGAIPFAYHADWRSAGRWGVEICTAKRRFILKPLETLQEMPAGSFGMASTPLDYQEPEGVKPGFYNMVEAFLAGDRDDFASLPQQLRRLTAFAPIGGLEE